MSRNKIAAAAFAACLLVTHAAAAQDTNILLPIDSIETLLRTAPFTIIGMQGSRFQGDRTQRVTLKYPDGSLVAAKWAKAPPGGDVTNNAPRYELAAYRIQELFLDPKDYVVPPTVLRSVPLAGYEKQTGGPRLEPTFAGTQSVLVVLQYWLWNVRADHVWDRGRFRSDTLYARRFANLNILTYLIHHNDANQGNLLISKDTTNPRVFAVDNGLAFLSEVSDRGTEWRDLKVNKLPRGTVDRLRKITDADLNRLLVLAQFQDQDGNLVRVPPTAPIDPNRGVARKDGVVQFGLTAREVHNTQRRLQKLLEDVDAGKITVF